MKKTYTFKVHAPLSKMQASGKEVCCTALALAAKTRLGFQSKYSN